MGLAGAKTVSDRQSFFERHSFLLRRLHSLSGIVPIGVFLIAHLTTNSSLAWGRFALRGEGEGMSIAQGGVKYFQEEVSYINEQVPHLLLIEVTLWVSIAFHAILGVYYATTGKGNTAHYPHMDNWRYSLQRISGYLGIAFIFYHVATLRWGWTWLVPGGTQWSHHFSASTLAAAIQGSPEGWTALGVAVALLYFAGITLLVFHFANGLWTAAITWGLTVSVPAQKRWGLVCFGLGAGLMLAAWSSLGAAFMVDPQEARATEAEMILHEHGPEELQRIENKLEGRPPADEHANAGGEG
ncbi:MAG: succinate dehydrogenase [Phycisphaeraceae bacterium]|nr:MAG: succinate dehydrogenase [Phycisphaeraceae bacterium]